MATKTIVTDDLDGSTDAATVSFSFDGKAYEIDLGKKNKAALEKAPRSYIDVARPVGARRRGNTRATSASKAASSLADIRTWASQNGYEVSARGRIAQSVVDAYNAAR